MCKVKHVGNKLGIESWGPISMPGDVPKMAHKSQRRDAVCGELQ